MVLRVKHRRLLRWRQNKPARLTVAGPSKAIVMLWRKFKMDWRYAIGELFIVVAGVLVALAIDQWNDERLERREADAILQHLLMDLQADLDDIEQMIRMAGDKEQSLLRLNSVFVSGQRPENETQFLQDIIVGADWGWNQVRPRSTTYQETLSSGKFGLIRDGSLRLEISRYYFDFMNMFDRADARETMFPQLSFQLVPRSRESASWDNLLQLDAGASADETARLVDGALRSAIREYVIGEINLARFILHLGADIRQRCEALMAEIETYRTSP